MSSLSPVLQAVLGVLVITAGAFDLKYRRVPNWLVLAGLVLGIGLNTALFGLPGLWLAVKGMGLGLLVYFPLYALRAMGAGDAKLMAAVGSIVGPGNWFVIFLITGILGGVVAIVTLGSRSRLQKSLGNVKLLLASLAHGTAPYKATPELDVRSGHGVRLPHAAVIAMGALIFLWTAAIYAPR